jgi:hypothetical protein
MRDGDDGDDGDDDDDDQRLERIDGNLTREGPTALLE